jgi:7-cyano-7-deazaguanine reductase
MNENPLGKTTRYISQYDPSQLYPIARKLNREKMGIEKPVFTGYDLWNVYELSWLSPSGKPEVRRGVLVYSSDSENIVESKSLKLYFNSLNMSVFESEEVARQTVEGDLKKILQTPFLKFYIFDYRKTTPIFEIPEDLVIDGLEISADTYHLDPGLLKTLDGKAEEELYTNLLKTNCPITGQPDWATVYVRYCGDKTAFLKYNISFREHGDYHEACCEKIFSDLFVTLEPEKLTVKCFFTRRGGIDINPCRFYGMEPDEDYFVRFWRQ